MRRHALDDYRLRLILWAVLAPHQKDGGRRPPVIPEILRDADA